MTKSNKIEEVRKRLKPFMGVRVEIGTDQLRAARYFSPEPTAKIDPRPTTWPMTSPALALSIGFLGMRKLQPRPGIVRGTSAGGGWPYIYDDWETSQGKKAIHECWVGTTGMGKTFALNCYLSRSLARRVFGSGAKPQSKAAGLPFPSICWSRWVTGAC